MEGYNMEGYKMKVKQQQINSKKKRPHRGILTLDDLDKTKWKHNLLITQFKARYQVTHEPGKDKSNQQNPEDYSI